MGVEDESPLQAAAKAAAAQQAAETAAIHAAAIDAEFSAAAEHEARRARELWASSEQMREAAAVFADRVLAPSGLGSANDWQPDPGSTNVVTQVSPSAPHLTFAVWRGAERGGRPMTLGVRRLVDLDLPYLPITSLADLGRFMDAVLGTEDPELLGVDPATIEGDTNS